MDELTLRKLLLKDFDEDFPIAGGWGSSREDSIVFLPRARGAYVKHEYDIIRAICIARGVSFKLIKQASFGHGGRLVDQVKVETTELTADEVITTTTNYYFDVSDCV